MKEKDLLATSLRQEAVYTRHLEEEKAAEEGQLDELRQVVNKAADELEVERSRRTNLAKDYEQLMAEYHHLQGELQVQVSSQTKRGIEHLYKCTHGNTCNHVYVYCACTQTHVRTVLVHKHTCVLCLCTNTRAYCACAQTHVRTVLVHKHKFFLCAGSILCQRHQ